jgi:hypothetical protein
VPPPIFVVRNNHGTNVEIFLILKAKKIKKTDFNQELF